MAEPKVVEMGQVTRVALAAPDHLGREADCKSSCCADKISPQHPRCSGQLGRVGLTRLPWWTPCYLGEQKDTAVA